MARFLRVCWVVAGTCGAWAGCGGGGTATGPTPRASSGRAAVQFHGFSGFYLPGDVENFTANTTDGGRDVTSTARWESSNPAVIVASPGTVRAVGPGQAVLRVSLDGFDDGTQTFLVAPVGPVPRPGRSRGDGVVIQELAPRGPRGSLDDFVVLKNASGAAVDLEGWSIVAADGTGATSFGRFFTAGTAAILSTTLLPGCHYLVSGRDFDSGTADASVPNYRQRRDFPDGGSVALVDDAGRIVDQVSLAGDGLYGEGEPIGVPPSSPMGSFERRSDTGDNRVDFEVRAVRNPKNSLAACAPTAKAP